jgi:hypothetical protein
MLLHFTRSLAEAHFWGMARTKRKDPQQFTGGKAIKPIGQRKSRVASV